MTTAREEGAAGLLLDLQAKLALLQEQYRTVRVRPV